jgi:hypothetical protein
VTLTGTSEAGSNVSIYEGQTLIGSATAGSDGDGPRRRQRLPCLWRRRRRSGW